ncbi:MAG: hypothetical protein K2X44_04505 [Magnetospirillum sp.]|nr:hypothetical protein [Magnetospirillum sp.]
MTSGQLTYKSTPSKVSAALVGIAQQTESGKLKDFRPPGDEVGFVPGRCILLTRAARLWVYTTQELGLDRSKMTQEQQAQYDALPSPAAMRIRLIQILSQPDADLCEGRDADCALKRVARRKKAGREAEAWAVRTGGPDPVRLFGVFLAPSILLLTHGHLREDIDWDKETTRIRRHMGDLKIQDHDLFYSPEIEHYFPRTP